MKDFCMQAFSSISYQDDGCGDSGLEKGTPSITKRTQQVLGLVINLDQNSPNAFTVLGLGQPDVLPQMVTRISHLPSPDLEFETLS